MRKLKYPCIYKHFKGKYYATMGVSNPIDISLSDFKLNVLKARHTETDKNVFILVDNNGNWYHDESIEKNTLVLYKSLYDDTSIYVRPYLMFLSEVDKVKHPNVDQIFRFEELK